MLTHYIKIVNMVNISTLMDYIKATLCYFLICIFLTLDFYYDSDVA